MPDCPPEILDLVERFDQNRDSYLSPSFNETELRVSFANPFFEALGWDVHNKQGHAEAYKDVVHEDTIPVGAGRKAPDYCFRIGGARKFFVETKKPAVQLSKDPMPAYQLRRYAWSAKLPLSVLTDFEEFALYDCRMRPSPSDKPTKGRVLHCRYEDYPTRWKEIAGVLSKDAVLRGDFDRYVTSTKKKRGTAEVDDAFLAEIETWRDLLARNFALRNKLSVRELNYAVACTIDRIIFLRMCEDRGVEHYGQLQGLLNGQRVYRRLFELFERADDRYNSGLFHFHGERGRTETPDELTPKLKLDDKPLKQILRGLYYPDSPYEFAVLPADVLGQVYEQFLGKVIRLTRGGYAKVEDKPEVKKAGGVYYTPTYIVDYIVKNTVGKLLEGKTLRQARKLCILDPACGSGSFLVAAYQFLLDWHRDRCLEEGPEKHRKILYQGRGGQWLLTTGEKKRILLDNLYGVDIDPQAVEVTKLSLLLKVLEGATREVLETQRRLFHERALPDLSSNVKCGNSLIGPDFYDGRQMSLLDDDEHDRINAFDWKAEFPKIMKFGGFDAVIGNPPYIRIQNLKEFAPLEVEFYKQRYKAASKGNYDIYVLFVERGLQLLNKDGRLGFILPHKFFNARYGRSLRQMCSEGRHLAHVVHFTDEQVFTGATTYTCLMFLTKTPNDSVDYGRVEDLDVWRNGGEAQRAHVPADHFTSDNWNIIIGPGGDLFARLAKMPVKLGDIAEKLFQGLVTSADSVFLLEPLGPEQDGYVPVQSRATGKEYLLETQVTHPLCKGALDVRSYVASPSRRVLFPYDPKASQASGRSVIIPRGTFERDCPNAWSYLLENLAVLRERERGKMRHDGWYGYVYPKSVALFAKPKILTPSIAAHASYAYDQEGKMYFVGSGGGGGGGYGIILHDDCPLAYDYILGLLNSRLLDFYLHQVASTFRGGYFAYNRQYIEQLPIRPIDFSDRADRVRHDRMVNLVHKMLDLHQRIGQRKTAHGKTAIQRQIDAIDRQIDQLVYELYGLTDEEIALVEEADTR